MENENIDVSQEETSKFHKKQEELVDILCSRTGSDDRNFFRVMVAYKFSELASNMRAKVNYAGTTGIPVNMYALDLAPSGYSKNASMNILDKDIFGGAKDKFTLDTFDKVKETRLALLADEISMATGVDIGECHKDVMKSYKALPIFLYQFGASTIEGVKSLRTKLSMAGIGATNNILDEIGHNIIDNKETFKLYFDTYDLGLSKNKLIKGDSNADLRGAVPCNLFAFGTQSRLLDGGTIEKTFFEFLEDGFGRRFTFGYVDKANKKKLTGAEKYAMINNPLIEMQIATLHKHFECLADESYYDRDFTVSQAVSEKLMDYQADCEERADELKEHEMILKAVIEHSYWRALKLAGAYAFIDDAAEITEEYIDNAVELCEESIASFRTMLKREKPYEKLARYIGDVEKKVTQVDLIEDLTFYRGSESQKRELMNLAIAYGYNNNIIIKKTIKDGIEFLEGDRLKEVDINNIDCSWSKDIAVGYKPVTRPFDVMHNLICENGFHYCSHSFESGHRKADNAVKGFNLLILDVDSGLPIEVCKTLLKDYKYLIATTKRHTESNNRYRIILPMSHRLELTAEEHKRFMKNVFDFMPFDCDEQTADIARKWQSFKGDHWYNEGKLIDVLPFIPDTTKQMRQKELSNKYTGVENLQRWFLMNFDETDGRNNMVLKYALALFDDGMSSENIRHSVQDLNSKLNQPLGENEIENTVMKTVIRKEFEREKV